MAREMPIPTMRPTLTKNKLYTAIAGIVVILMLVPVIGIWTLVSAGHVGVVTRFGAVSRVVQPGVVFKLPFVEAVDSMETRTQKDQVEAEAASADLQSVHATIAVNYHLDGQKAVVVYQNLGTE